MVIATASLGGLLTACSGGAGPTFVPKGAAAAAPAVTAPSAAAEQNAPGLLAFPFPATVRVRFATPLPGGQAQRGAVIGYENYIDSMWYAVYTHGASKAYRRYVDGNALSFAKQLIGEFSAGHYRLRGTIVYSGTSVPEVYYGAGAVVESCVNSSGLYRVGAAGAAPVFSGAFAEYQEQASAGRLPDGLWFVDHTENYTGPAAGTCAS